MAQLDDIAQRLAKLEATVAGMQPGLNVLITSFPTQTASIQSWLNAAPGITAQLKDNAAAHAQIGVALNELTNAVQSLNNNKQGPAVDIVTLVQGIKLAGTLLGG